ncbi:hypothetical protein [Mycolicibacterium neworleansense]|uniref:PE-PGRS family protein n=1 Tax=Mycolicibacterium neworleansense TaxID=146018 RepID=A0A0H5RW96_9MYCO|nr:hypothetical protein [Mycolicibacterium neworleansense]MCV7361241.1 hypothetical protein [Mycolicibacterium neworleansense]CRZ18390.1 hypothetical protein BN2156_05291 [Mycolicibacterium neworleansense]
MDVAVRPWLTTGVALVGATAVAMSPATPSWQAPAVQVTAPTVTSPVQLTDVEWPYILSLPIVRQSIRNWAENWAVYLAGLAQAGIGLGQSVLAIPGVTVEIIQQIFDLNFVGAFDTFTQAVRDAVVAVGQPLLDSAIWRNQKYLVVEAALSAAWPQAVIDVANGLLDAGSGVATSFIVGTQNLVAAVLTFDLSNIVDAAVDGTRNFLISLGDGARSIVDGIEAAQLGITTALATAPPPPPDFTTSSRSPLSVAQPIGLAAPANAVILDVPAAPDVVDLAPVVEPAPAAPAKLVAELEDPGPIPTKRIARPAKDTAQRVQAEVKDFSDRVSTGLKKHLGLNSRDKAETRAGDKPGDQDTADAKPSRDKSSGGAQN